MNDSQMRNLDLLCFPNDCCEYWSRLIPALAMGQLIDSERLVKQWFPHGSEEEGSEIIIPEMLNNVAVAEQKCYKWSFINI